MTNLKQPSAEAQMLIRKSAQEVFQAFIDPEITKIFWFSKGSGKLEVGKEIFWTWEKYDLTTKVVATQIINNELIMFDWYAGPKAMQVVISLKKIDEASTFVVTKHTGFDQEGEELIEALKDSTGGFNIVLAGLKAHLEHGIKLNLIEDKVV